MSTRDIASYQQNSVNPKLSSLYQSWTHVVEWHLCKVNQSLIQLTPSSALQFFTGGRTPAFLVHQDGGVILVQATVSRFMVTSCESTLRISSETLYCSWLFRELIYESTETKRSVGRRSPTEARPTKVINNAILSLLSVGTRQDTCDIWRRVERVG